MRTRRNKYVSATNASRDLMAYVKPECAGAAYTLIDAYPAPLKGNFDGPAH
jgi:hypothetical protein